MVAMRKPVFPIILLTLLLIASAVHAQTQTTDVTASVPSHTSTGNLEGYILMGGVGVPANVTVQSPSNKTATYGTVTADEYGHYKIKELASGTYILNITPSGYYGGFLSEKFTINAGNSSRLNVPIAYKSGQISGNVLLENVPFDNCLISLYSPNDLKTPLYQVRTNDNGHYVFDDVVSADSPIKPLKVSTSYNITVSSDKIAPNWTLSNSYVVKSGKTTTANIKISFLKGDIYGTIQTLSGFPVTSAVVKLYLANKTYTSSEIANTTTDLNGTYAFKKIIATPGGNATIRPGDWWPDYRYKVVANSSTVSATESKPLIVAPSATTIVNITFSNKSYKTGNISGFLLTDTGYCVPNVTIKLVGNDGNKDIAIIRTVTGSDGSFSFDNVYSYNSPVKPTWWTGDYWLTYSNARVGPFKLKVNETLVKNVTVTAQPYIVSLTPERHYVKTDGQCIITAQLYDRWGNPYKKDAKIGVEIAYNESYEGVGTGALNTNNKVSLIPLTVTGGETNITYGWANPLYTGWNVTILAYPYPKRSNTIVSNCTLTIISPDTPYPVERPIADETPVIPTEAPLPDQEDDSQGNETAEVQPTPAPTDEAPQATPTPVSNSGNPVDQILAFLKSIFNWK